MRGTNGKLVSLLGLLVILTAGCSGEGPERISGTVTFKGQPLDQGTIQFEPADRDAVSHSGGMVENGNYKVPATKGLMPGKYRVSIFSPDRTKKVPERGANGKEIPGMGGGAYLVAVERIPAKYNTKSQEIVEVKKGGPNVFDFKID